MAFRLRNVHSLNRYRLGLAILLLALIPLVTQVDSLVALGVVSLLYMALIAFEAIHFAEARDRIRHQLVSEGSG